MYLIIRTLILVLGFANTSVAFAQAPVELPPNAGEEVLEPVPAEASSVVASCFDFYSSGTIQVTMETAARVVTPEATMTVTGEVKNKNSHVFLNGVLLVKIFQKNGAANATADTDKIVDQFTAAENLKIPAQGSVAVSYTWKVPHNMPAGEYYASYYVLDENRYNLAGLNYMEGIVGGKTMFTITREQAVPAPVSFVKSATTLNGESYSFVGRSPYLEVGIPVVITTDIVNPTNESKTVPLQWNQYAWDDTREENLRFTKTEVVTLAAGEAKTVSYEVHPQSEAVVYVSVLTQDNQAKSIVPIRHVRTGVEEPRLSFSGLTEFPIKKDTEQKLYACVQSTNETVVSNNVVTITVKDKGGTVVGEYTYEGDVTGAPVAVGKMFSLPVNLNYAVVTTTLKNKGTVVDEVVQIYDCEALDSNSCLPETDTLSENILKQIFPYLLGGMLIIGLITFFMLRRKNHITVPNGEGIRMFFISIMFGTMLFGGATLVQAADVTWQGDIPINPGSTVNHLETRVTYSATIQNVTTGQGVTNGANVAVGDRLLIQATPFSNNQIVWYPRQTPVIIGGTAFYYGYAPLASSVPRYGYFLPGAATPGVACDMSIAAYLFATGGICIGHAFYGSGGPGDGGGSCIGGGATKYAYYPLSVNPPAVSYNRGGTAGMTCNVSNTDCTVTSAGSISFQINFEATYGRNTEYRDDWFCFQYYGDSPFANGPGQNFTIPAQSIGFGLTAVQNNLPPATPTITGPATGIVNTSYDFNVSGTDPDGNALRYGIADASCTTVSQWLPGAGHVSSGTSQTYSRSWAGTGPQTIYVLSEDSNGARSGCAQHAITVNPVPPPTANLTANGSGGPINVVRNQTITLAWSSTNAASCSKWGGAWGAGQTVGISGSESTVVTASSNYLINCGGATDTVVVNVVNQNPNAPTITHPSGSAPYNTNTTFTITGTDPDGDNVFYEIDWNNDGVFDATSATVPTGTGVSAIRSWTATGPQTFQARTVDTAGGRSGWTSHVINIQLPAAATATLEAQVNGGAWSGSNQTVNPGDTVTLRWTSTNATSCTASGAGFSTPSTSGTDGVTTPAPNTTTAFQVTCTGPGGSGSGTMSITTRQSPNFTTPLITFNPLAFNTTTATYDSVEVIFQTSNNGGSDTAASANYQFQFDRGSNGYDVTTSGSLGLLAVSASVNRTETVSNVPLGNNRIQVTVDSTNAVNEVNEGDNTNTLDIVIPPPNPGINITANRTQVRSGETVTLTWTATLVYPMDCRVFGPGVNVNPSGLNGTQLTQPITAKSEFTLSCTEPVTGTVFTDSVIVEAQGEIEEI